MKKIFGLIILSVLMALGEESVCAQIDSGLVTTTLNVELITTEYKDSRSKLLDFIQQNHIRVQNQTEGKNNIDIDFILTEAQYQNIEQLLPQLGYVVSKRLNTLNNITKVKEAELELAFLNQKKETFKVMLNKIEEKSDKYYELWKDIESLDESIYNKKREMLSYFNTTNDYVVTLNLSEEDTTPQNTKISFVNMPGVEYSYLNIESPDPSISAKSYQGYFVKYLFTRGKSYAQAGAYKRINAQNADSAQYSELFLLAFGQDFYTRHLGRGERKFLNLYSGYTVGSMIASNDFRKYNIFYITPSVGLELFKNKYFLVDTKVSYFIPFSYNRNLRGISYSGSFNFVF